MRKTTEQRLAELDRQRARLAEKARADATREKIVIGAAIAGEMRENADFCAVIRPILLRRVTRDTDKRAITQILTSHQGEHLGLPEFSLSKISRRRP